MASASKSDLKIELIQELERQRGKVSKLPKTQKNILILLQLKKLRGMLEKSSIKPGFYFGADKFLQESQLIKYQKDYHYGLLFPEEICLHQNKNLA